MKNAQIRAQLGLVKKPPQTFGEIRKRAEELGIPLGDRPVVPLVQPRSRPNPDKVAILELQRQLEAVRHQLRAMQKNTEKEVARAREAGLREGRSAAWERAGKAKKRLEERLKKEFDQRLERHREVARALDGAAEEHGFDKAKRALGRGLRDNAARNGIPSDRLRILMGDEWFEESK